MGKVTLGKRPKTFTKTVEAMTHGGKVLVEAVYTYRTRTEFGAFVDRLSDEIAADFKAERDAKAAKADAAAPPDSHFRMGSIQDRSVDQQARYIMQIMQGWGLDIEFNEQSVRELCDGEPALAEAFTNSYREAITEGRLGN